MELVLALSSLRIYLLAATRLERAAMRCLLFHELNVSAEVESDFSPAQIWDAMRGKPDLALAVIDRPTPDIRDALEMIPRLRAQTTLAICGGLLDDSVLSGWADCKVNGFFFKDGGVEELRSGLSALAEDREWFSHGTRESFRREGRVMSRNASLSRRESELLPLLTKGMTLREAAVQMAVSYKTADSYRTSLLRKLGVHSRVELVRYAIRERLVEL